MYDSITVLPPPVEGLEGLVLGGGDAEMALDEDLPNVDSSFSERSIDDLPDDSVVDESEEEPILEDD
jgi:hypothetical protein